MTRIVAVLAVVLALAAVGRADEPAPATPESALRIPEATWDAGKVVRGTKLVHAFVLKNVGIGELGIDAKPG